MGRQIPKKFINEINNLGLLNEEETIKYFYSDAMVDIKNGMYIVTDKRVILQNQNWEEPETTMKLSEIDFVKSVFDDSFLIDSMVYIETTTGLEVCFPHSSEQGRDKIVVNFYR